MKLIFGFLIWVVAILIFGIPLGIFWIYKFLLEKVITKRKTRSGEQWFPLSANDAIAAPGPTWIKSNINVGFALKLKRNIEGNFFSLKELKDHFAKVFLDENKKGGKYDKLCSYIASKGGYTFRVQKPSIDLDEHILKLNWRKYNVLGSHQCLNQILNTWISLKWRDGKPCWEIILLDNPSENEDELILAFKIHHGLADGYSLLHILDELTGNKRPYLVRDFEESTIAKIKTGIGCATYLHRMNQFTPSENVFRVNLTESNRYESFISFLSLPLDGIKAIRRKHQVSVVSIIFTIIIGSMRRYAKNDFGSKSFPKEVGILTTFGWPKHPSSNSESRNADKICNHWTFGNGKASLDEDDPVRRMKQIHTELETCQNLGLPKFQKRVLFRVMSTLPCILRNRFVSMDKGYGVFTSSLVGGDNYSLLGCKAEQILPISSGHDFMPNMPVICFTFSHSGRIEMMLKFHSSVIKDQEAANNISKEYCMKEFRALLSAGT